MEMSCLSRCYQAHHHVHWADFDRVDSLNKLLDLVKGGPMGVVMSTTATDQLRGILGCYSFICDIVYQIENDYFKRNWSASQTLATWIIKMANFSSDSRK